MACCLDPVLDQVSEYATKAERYVGNVPNWYKSSMGFAFANAFNSIPQKSIENGKRSSNGAPKMIAFARFRRGWEKCVKSGCALVFGQV
jgi:hypothetical protein